MAIYNIGSASIQATPTFDITPTGLITATADKLATTHQISSADDAELIPSNVKYGSNIFGTVGEMHTINTVIGQVTASNSKSISFDVGTDVGVAELEVKCLEENPTRFQVLYAGAVMRPSTSPDSFNKLFDVVYFQHISVTLVGTTATLTLRDDLAGFFDGEYQFVAYCERD